MAALALSFGDLQNQPWDARRAIKLVDEATKVLAIVVIWRRGAL